MRINPFLVFENTQNHGPTLQYSRQIGLGGKTASAFHKGPFAPARRLPGGLIVLVAAALLAGCATSRREWTRSLTDGRRWSRMEFVERSAEPATAALMAELDRAEADLMDHLAQGAGDNERSRSKAYAFRDFRIQIEDLLVNDAAAVPHARAWREVTDDRRLAASMRFAEGALPLYDLAQILDPQNRAGVVPYNADRVYTGMTGDAFATVSAAYRPSPYELIKRADRARIYRFAARADTARDLLDALTRPDAAAVQIRFFQASRLDDGGSDAVTDAVVFYWEAGPDAGSPVFLGMDYVQTPFATGAPVRASDPRPPARALVRAQTPIWRILICGPFEAVARLVTGVKQGAFEIAKAPLKVPGQISRGPGAALSVFWQGFARAWSVGEVLVRVRPMRWPHQSVGAIMGEIPILGKLTFGACPGVEALRGGATGMTARRDEAVAEGLTLADGHHYLTMGTGLGNDKEQWSQAWTQVVAARVAGAKNEDVVALADPYGSLWDRVFSCLNLSDGPAYAMAREILFPDPDWGRPDAAPGERVYLHGYGTGARRIRDTARILHRAGVTVTGLTGWNGDVGDTAGLAPGQPIDVERFHLLSPRGARNLPPGAFYRGLIVYPVEDDNAPQKQNIRPAPKAAAYTSPGRSDR